MKHIKVRYFFIKDKVEKGEVEVLTKPLQGEKFRKMRSMLMNSPEDY